MARNLEEREKEVKTLHEDLIEAREARDSAQDAFMELEKQVRDSQASSDSAAEEAQASVARAVAAEERVEEPLKEVARLDLETARLSDEAARGTQALSAAQAETRAAEEAYARTVGGLRAKNAELRRRLQGMQDVLGDPLELAPDQGSRTEPEI